jgi:hypothetical protein
MAHKMTPADDPGPDFTVTFTARLPVPTAEDLFGRKTGRHTHPATHPAWLEFSDQDCPACHPEMTR